MKDGFGGIGVDIEKGIIFRWKQLVIQLTNLTTLVLTTFVFTRKRRIWQYIRIRIAKLQKASMPFIMATRTEIKQEGKNVIQKIVTISTSALYRRAFIFNTKFFNMIIFNTIFAFFNYVFFLQFLTLIFLTPFNGIF